MADHAAANGKESYVTAALNCIDLSNPDIHQSAALIKQACMDSGIFYVINHGISEELMAEVFAQTKKFFTLPWEEKMKLRTGRNRGYDTRSKKIDSQTNKELNGEQFMMVRELPYSDKEAENPLTGPNVWPSADILPGWKETMLKYQQAVLNVGTAVARIIAVALDLKVDFFDQPAFLGNALPYVSLNHYGAEDVDPSKEYLLGTPAHCDPPIITLLATDDVPGLQICKDKHAKAQIWQNVSPLKGAFIVNTGNTLERMSNCVFRSTMHRVLYRQDRYTIAFLLYPSNDAVIECIPSCKSAENPPKFPPIKSDELLRVIANDIVAGRVTRDATDA
ncbi:2-oxoglutarate (2OG) and Fe(II)-dependent oxygenase superfamily protein [Melia azedarach]|uniref:2-oxoglutarate (2OG) and Fe(II)-dependent oxygenase superfamily protein n=1 Tax=Melia azedarach TaxID=155640 RepID=A0ACC1XSA5_MELAZ|nr:2-oxoglutarate (2OG) and Fe(II)-dependent oxygenase superfamily protein [Melia azedarach]